MFYFIKKLLSIKFKLQSFENSSSHSSDKNTLPNLITTVYSKKTLTANSSIRS